MNPIFSVIGPHAGESIDSIFLRKNQDITNHGFCLWFFKVNILCKPEYILPRAYKVLFLHPKVKGGAKDTKIGDRVTSYFDGSKYVNLPLDMSPVTGKIQKGSCCLMIRKLITHGQTQAVHLAEYCTAFNRPIRFRLGQSTIIGYPRFVDKQDEADLVCDKNPETRFYDIEGVLDEVRPIVEVK